MELFTLGIGNYTEDDVKAGARALTGWTVDRATGTARSWPRRHDAGAKTILGADRPTSTPTRTPTCWSRQPAQRGVPRRAGCGSGSPRPSPSRSRHAARLAAAYGAGRDVTALLRGAVRRPGVRRPPRGQLVKQPVEWVVGALRQLGIRPCGAAEQRAPAACCAGCSGLDQVPLRPPSVGGWPAGARLADHLVAAGAAAPRRRAARRRGRPAGRRPAGGGADDRPGRRAGPAAGRRRLDRPHPRRCSPRRPAEPRRLLALGLASPEYTVH